MFKIKPHDMVNCILTLADYTVVAEIVGSIGIMTNASYFNSLDGYIEDISLKDANRIQLTLDSQMFNSNLDFLRYIKELLLESRQKFLSVDNRLKTEIIVSTYDGKSVTLKDIQSIVLLEAQDSLIRYLSQDKKEDAGTAVIRTDDEKIITEIDRLQNLKYIITIG